MFVSIITCTHNSQGTVAKCIQSVQEQSYAQIEHVIQDGNSTDKTLEIIRKSIQRGALIESAPDCGVYDALNKAIERASGDIIGILHSDDIFASKDIIKEIVDCFEQKHIDAVYGDLSFVEPTKNNLVLRQWKAGAYSEEKLKLGWMIPHPTLFIRREFLNLHGQYDASYKIAGDYAAMLRWFLDGKMRCFYYPKILVNMSIGGKSTSFKQYLLKYREDVRALKSYVKYPRSIALLKILQKLMQIRSISYFFK